MRLSPRDMLARLVAFPTVSARSNLDLIGFVRAHLESHGIACRLVPNTEGTKANLWATLGPDAPGGVVLSGHTDVVPVEGQAWTADPFALTERDGRLYGRGSADMKGFLAIALALVPDMLAAGLKRPIHLALSYDEEVGCLGAPAMIEDMFASGLAPSAVIVGEPSSMKVVTRHKGFLGLDTVVTGHEVHSSQLHRGVSAVTVAARLIAWLADRTAENAVRPGDPLFDPPYTTLHCGRVEGGTAHNIVAKSARFTTDIRTVPGDDLDAVERAYLAEVARRQAAMRTVAPAAGISVTRFACVPGLGPEPDGAAETLARRLTGDNSENVVPFSSEAGQFQAAGFSTVICGPGDIAQAHQPDEFVTLEQFEAGIAFQRRLIAELAR